MLLSHKWNLLEFSYNIVHHVIQAARNLFLWSQEFVTGLTKDGIRFMIALNGWSMPGRCMTIQAKAHNRLIVMILPETDLCVQCAGNMSD